MSEPLAYVASLAQDFRLAVRSLRKSPGFLTVVTLSLALGIGANSTIFSVIDTLLYRPLPYDHPEQLITIWNTNAGEGVNRAPIAESLDWKRQNHVFQDIALTSFDEEAVLSGAGAPEHVTVQDVTPNFFSLLGVKPILGRIFFPSEMQDYDQTIVISYSFWKTHFNKNPNVLGKTLKLSGMPSTVVGVMPEGFAPFDGVTMIWQPVNPESQRYADRSDHWLIPIARLKPSVTQVQAQAEMDAIAHRLEQQYPTSNKGVGKKLVPLRETLYGWARRALYPLFGAVAFVLLIACANVANLIQSRSEGRRGESAVRLSLGATRARLVQQSLVESMPLGLLGCAFGLLIAFWGIRVFLWIAGSDFPNADSMAVNLRVVVFTLGISLLTTLLFGIAPALQASKTDVNNALRDGARGTAPSSRGIMRHFLVVSEVALAMVLLVGTGLMINTMLRLRHVNPGFDTKNLLTMTFQLPEGGKYVERVPGGDMERATPAVTSFYQRLLERVSALPGVESAASMTGLPTHFMEWPSFVILGRPVPKPDQRPNAACAQVSPNIFRTLGIPLKKGRFLDEHDTSAGPWAIVVNEAVVRRYFPNEDPIGKEIRLRYDPYPTDEDHPRQIVGVVGDIKQRGLAREPIPFMYTSFLQEPEVYPGGSVVAHLWQDLAVRMAPGARIGDLTKAIRQIVTELDPDQPIANVMSMDQVLRQDLGDTRSYMQLLSIFAMVAVFLAGMGIYGVMSYFVTRHTHDIGIRMALGAHPSNILRWVASLAAKLVLLGIVVGIGLALGLTRAISALLFGVTPTDPITFLIVAITLALVACMACYIPAHRATKLDPLVSLRYE
jgi:putative ABC transport system permease protein